MRLSVIALGLSAWIGILPATPATLSHFTTLEGREVIALAGEIMPGDADQFISLARQVNLSGVIISGIRLNSPGGNLLEGVKLADAIRTVKIATVVTRGSTCASACFVAFAAGGEKFASYGARVGVHGASMSGVSGPIDAPAGTVAMAKIVRDLGVPSGIIGQMVVTPPTEIVWLSAADLQSMGVQLTGVPAEIAARPFENPANGAVAQPAVPTSGTMAQGTGDPIQVRRAVAPLVRALTDCVARQTLADEAAVPEYRDGTFNAYLMRAIDSCPNFVAGLVQVYDRMDGVGQGHAFLAGPYAADLPRAVLKRIKPQLDERLAALNREIAEQSERAAQEKAAADEQKKADALARAEQALKEEADRKAALALAEQRAAEGRAAADRAEADAKAAAAKLETARLDQVADAKKAQGLLAERASDCARHQLPGLVRSGEAAEVLAAAVMTICGPDVSALLDGGTQEWRLERNAPADDVSDGAYRERLRAETRDQIVALAVQAKAGLGFFAPAQAAAATP